METTVKLYSLSYSNTRSYLFILLFVAGNIVFPQLCHYFPGGGPVFLPIYFFTLIAAYKYGLLVGLATGILSPLVNSMLFGMPAASLLPVILVKSGLLAVAAAYAAQVSRKVSFAAILVAILVYQVAGTLFEWVIVSDFRVAIQDFRVGMPGMLVQLFGGYGVLKALRKV